MHNNRQKLVLACALAALVAGCNEKDVNQAADAIFPDTGTAYCWGDNEGQGQLGDGTNTDRLKPTKVATDVSFSRLTAGGQHTCGIAKDGSAYCWGDNEGQGQLGDGTHFDRLKPTQVKSEQFFVDLVAGGQHTCGLALGDTGAAYCWGSNGGQGQLGDGTNFDRLTPVKVKGDHEFVDLAAGAAHSCGVTTTGDAYCWGDNDGQGQLGIGNNNDQLVPKQVTEIHNFSSIVAGGNHTCGLTENGSAYCWGNNHPGQGQLGDGTNNDALRPVKVVGGHTFVDLAAGAEHSCGVTEEGAAYCWGNNHPGEGQLGVGDNNDRLKPALVKGEHHFTQIAAGGNHTCAVTKSGDAYCWGNNYPGQGQLGVGDNNDRLTPEKVAGNHHFMSITAGGGINGDQEAVGHTCGLVDDSG